MRAMALVAGTVVIPLVVGCGGSTPLGVVDGGGAGIVVVDTNQTQCYDNTQEIGAPAEGEAFYGQDAQYDGRGCAYRDNGDGTVTDTNTGLMWAEAPATQKMNADGASAYAATATLAGYGDWRLPSIKELYSLIDHSTGWPYIDETVFECGLDPQESKNTQYWSSTDYVGTTHGGQATRFGVNFATGHIKGYGTGMPAYVRLVRSGVFGPNSLTNSNNGTVTDAATGLMWQQADSGVGMNWEDALAYAENLVVGGYYDWRLPNAKELQSIVDYAHSPNAATAAASGPAIDSTVFDITPLAAGETAHAPDYGYFWTSTSAYHGAQSPEYCYAWYVAFGTAPDPSGTDVHGAGAVRFDAKTNASILAVDDERVYNYVRCVRGTSG